MKKKISGALKMGKQTAWVCSRRRSNCARKRERCVGKARKIFHLAALHSHVWPRAECQAKPQEDEDEDKKELIMRRLFAPASIPILRLFDCGTKYIFSPTRDGTVYKTPQDLQRDMIHDYNDNNDNISISVRQMLLGLLIQGRVRKR